MDQTAKAGLVVIGLSIMYVGFDWFTNKTTCMVGKISQNVSIYSYMNNPQKWSDLKQSENYKTFDLVPVYFKIIEQTNDCITIETSAKKVVCKFKSTVDLKYNTCTMCKCMPSTDTNYNGILNHPTMLQIALQPGQQVVINGYYDADGIFRIIQLSNYPPEKYRNIIVSQKMWKISCWLFGLVAFGSLRFLFQQYKE